MTGKLFIPAIERENVASCYEYNMFEIRYRYFFELTTGPNVLWANLTKFDLKPGASVMTLDPDNMALSGDVTERFQKAERAPF